ncbi:rod-binding protein [Pseudohoeflea coraliihabitans]|uniref:Rod-binding protein n=1 Tax=Pseudohoeflea coraliihabitans TaxID=2860393 RepID=A0ABS6WN29_9HYPH|nr:rod-binding protein [Pseudohoeflea sp. DP4N28-3]MBW3097344.1 rod-binding protein [Pseudohoeflea sp. DP4N28-3]
MAVAIATDLILDVVKAAAPEVAQQAKSVLQAAAGRKAEANAASGLFERQIAGLNEAAAVDLRARLAAQAPAQSDEVPEAYREFEAMVLGSFVQSMLPSDNEEVFGKGTAGEIWKGMMAEKIGQVMAEDGGVGIAERMASRAAGKVVPADEFAENTVNRAASMVNQVQMAILGDLGRLALKDEDQA